MDVREGGTRHIGMEMAGPTGSMRMWFAGEHTVVEPARALGYTDTPADEHGVPLAPEQAGLPPGHPHTTEVYLVLEPTGHGTRIVLTHTGIAPNSPGAAGWEMALTKLAERLTS